MAEGDESRDDRAPDDRAPDGAGFDDAFLEPGPRRSTYTPPPDREFVAKPSVDEPDSVPDESEVPDEPEESTGGGVVYSLDDVPLSRAPEPEPEPDPSPGPPEVPERRSLTDDELERVATSAPSTLDALDEFERQLRLRAEEAERYQSWEQSMLASGTPEAVAAVEEVRPQFEDVVTSSIAVQQPVPVEVVEPEPAVAGPQSEPEPEAVPGTDPVVEEPEAATPPPLVEPPEFGAQRFSAPWTDLPEPASPPAEPAAADPPAEETTFNPFADLPAPVAGTAQIPDVAPVEFIEPAVAGEPPAEEPPATPPSDFERFFLDQYGVGGEGSVEDAVPPASQAETQSFGGLFPVPDDAPPPPAPNPPSVEPANDFERFFMDQYGVGTESPTERPNETGSFGGLFPPPDPADVVETDAAAPSEAELLAAAPPPAPTAAPASDFERFFMDQYGVGEDAPAAAPVEPAPSFAQPNLADLFNAPPPSASERVIAPEPVPESAPEPSAPEPPALVDPPEPPSSPDPFAFASAPFPGAPFASPSAAHTPFDATAFPPPAQPVDIAAAELEPEAPEEPAARPDFAALAFGEAGTETENAAAIVPVAIEERPRAARAPIGPEDIGILPTPAEQRVGRAVRSFWLWFAANASVVSVAFGGVLFSLGMSVRQAVIATFIGVVISFIPLGLGTLAGKRSGQPTLVVSRATFGIYGNVLPSIIAIVSRVFWGALLLWLLGRSVSAVLTSADATAGLTSTQLTIAAMGIAFVIALVIAFFGFRLIAVFQLVVSVVSAVLIVGLVVLTWPYVHVSLALTKGDGSAILLVTGAVLVFSFVGLAWANASGDLARFQKPSGSSVGSSLFAGFGTALPTFALISYGALLAASNTAIAKGFLSNPLDTLSRMLPSWYPVPLLVAAAVSLLSGVVVSIYSGSFAIAATGLRIKQSLSTILAAVIVFLVGWAFSTLDGDLVTLFRDAATTIAVPVAAWVGIFAADMSLRRGRFNTRSLLRVGGIYPAIRPLNFAALIVITAIGWGLTTATLSGLDWQGYIFSAADVSPSSDLAQSDLGVFVALVLGLLISFVGGLRSTRAQEAADVAE